MALGVLTLGVGACDGALDTTPVQSVEPGQITSSLTTYRNLVASAYNRLQSTNLYGQRMVLAPEILADNARIGPVPSARYRGEEQNSLGTGIGGLGTWNTLYSLVNDANYVIAGVDAPTSTNAADDALKARLKGEAYFLRGMAYFDLARIFAYEPTQAAARGFTDGVIIRTTPTKDATDAAFRGRSPVDSVYLQIESDLMQSITLLTPTSVGATSRTRANRVAPKALLARVYLYAGRYADAESYATQAMTESASLASGGARLTTAAQHGTSFGTQPNPESIFELAFNAQTESNTVNESLVSLVQPAAPGQGQWGDVVPSAELIALFGATDVRRGIIDTLRRNNVTFVVTTKYNNALGNYADNVPLIRFAEMLLIRAESRLAQGNAAGALADLNLLRTNRNATALTAADVTVANILRERRLELNYEGQRFFDLKRLGLPITKAAVTAVTTINPGDPRVLAPIPAGQVQLNSGLRQNPGY